MGHVLYRHRPLVVIESKAILNLQTDMYLGRVYHIIQQLILIESSKYKMYSLEKPEKYETLH